MYDPKFGYRAVDLAVEARPGKPPKDFKKRKAVAIYICLGDHCVEGVRAIIGSNGDIYIPLTPPQLGKLWPAHESFHASGQHHWVFPGEKGRAALLGKEDAPRAFKLAFFNLLGVPCLCFRRGMGLESDEIRALVERLIAYTPLYPHYAERVGAELASEGFSRWPRPDLTLMELRLKGREGKERT